MFKCICVQGKRTGCLIVLSVQGIEDRMYKCICVQGRRTGCIIV